MSPFGGGMEGIMKKIRNSKMLHLRRLVSGTLFLVICVAVLYGCTKNQVDLPTDSSITPSTDSKATEVSTGESTETAADESSGNVTDSNVINEDTVPKGEDAVRNEMAFIYNDNIIGISDVVDEEELESILGEAEETKSHTYSLDDGLNMDTLIGFTEKQYKFPGLEIKTINAAEDEKFEIFHIEITDSRYVTIRNIKVGDSVETLMEAYPEGNMVGNGTPNEEDVFQYLPENYAEGIEFRVANGTIESILIYKLLD